MLGQLILCWVKLWGFFLLCGKKKVKFLGTVINLEVIKDIYLSFVLLLRFFFFFPEEPARQRSLSPSGEFLFFVLFNIISLCCSTFFGGTVPKLKDNMKALNISCRAMTSHLVFHTAVNLVLDSFLNFLYWIAVNEQNAISFCPLILWIYTNMKQHVLLNNPNSICAPLVPHFITWCFSDFRRGLRKKM